MKLVYGVGINDADYVVNLRETVGYTAEGKQIQSTIYSCPFYIKWRDMISRCYNHNFLKANPSYKDCSVVPEWHYFMTFRAWMEKQDWEGNCLDKDILVPGNKIYGPDTCVFIDQKVNKFLNEREKSRGQFPIGVDFRKVTGNYRASCWDVVTGKRKHLGHFSSPEKAHEAWLNFKLEQACILALSQNDIRVAEALVNRYKNYKFWSKE